MGRDVSALGRAAIAMAAVRRRACREPGKITDHPDVRPPTDVMAITSLPRALGRGVAPPLPGVHHAADEGIRLGQHVVLSLPRANKYNLSII